MPVQPVRILNLETATKNCSVSVYQDGELRSVREFAGEHYSHAEKLNLFIEETMREAGMDFGDLSAVAVSKGPGSYTGLRIGVSSAKGICFAHDIPLIAVDTLQVLAKSVSAPYDYIIPVLDARRMEVYHAIFDQNFHYVQETSALVLDEDSYSGLGKHSVVFTGDAVEKMQKVIRLPQADFIFRYPSARELGVLSYMKYKDAEFVDTAYFEPYYLKDFIAVKSVPKL